MIVFTINKLKNYKRKCLTSFFLVFLSLTIAQAQDDSTRLGLKLSPEVCVGVIAGGKIYNQRFIYNDGALVQLTLNHNISEKVQYGLGLGLENLKKETFLPVYFSFTGNLKKKASTPFLLCQFGYAFWYNQNAYYYINYKYRGGLFFSPGFGYQFPIKDKYTLRLKLNYKHQFAYISYEPFEGKTYEDELSIHQIAFTIGLLMR